MRVKFAAVLLIVVLISGVTAAATLNTSPIGPEPNLTRLVDSDSEDRVVSSIERKVEESQSVKKKDLEQQIRRVVQRKMKKMKEEKEKNSYTARTERQPLPFFGFLQSLFA